MKKMLLFLMGIIALLPITAFAQDITLVKYVTSNGSLSLMVPDGWHVEEDLNFFPSLLVTNDPDLPTMSEFPDTLGPDEYALAIFVMDAEIVGLTFSEIALDAPFEQWATDVIDFLAESSDDELSIRVNKMTFEALDDGQDIALAEAEMGELEAIISLHEYGDGLVMSMNLTASGGSDALREIVLQVVSTVELISEDIPAQNAVNGNQFAALGDPNLAVDVQDAVWISDYAAVNLSGEAIQAFEFSLSDAESTDERRAWLEISGLPIDIELGVYDVEPSGPINAEMNVLSEGGAYNTQPLVGTITLDEADASITGRFDLQTIINSSNPVQATTVTGAFSGVAVPDVGECVIYSATSSADGRASLEIVGANLIEVALDEAVWVIEPGVPAFPDNAATVILYINSVEGTGAGSYLIVTGIRHELESGEFGTSSEVFTEGLVATLIQVAEAADGSRSAEVRSLSGTVLISSGQQLSGSFDLVVNGAEDTRISGDFADIPLPAENCT